MSPAMLSLRANRSCSMYCYVYIDILACPGGTRQFAIVNSASCKYSSYVQGDNINPRI